MKIVIALLFVISSVLGYLLNNEHLRSTELQSKLDKIQIESVKQDKVEQSTKQLSVSTPIPTPASSTPRNKPTIPEEVVTWRLAAIEKLVPLTDEQREELRDKFSYRSKDPLTPQRTVDEILGKESAAIYAEAKSRARARVKSESLEKDVLYISRRLNLSQKEEENLRDVVFQVDAEIEEQKDKDPVASPYAGFSKYLELERLRRDLLQKQLQQFLDTQKFNDYLKLQAESADVEIEMWHGE